MREMSAFLKALTPETLACLGVPVLRIPYFPFKVGRESRLGEMPKFPDSRRRTDSVPNNDLYLHETGSLLNVSREHFQIEARNGDFYLVDRGSACGTLVEGAAVGQDRSGGETLLQHGDVIIVGTSSSRHIFKFVTATER